MINQIKNVAVLTSGTDAPGMNAAIRCVVRTAIDNKCRVFGVQDGYTGLLDDKFIELTSISVSDIIQRGGTFLGTSSSKRFWQAEYRKMAAENLRKRDIDTLIVIGGDGSLRGAHLLSEETGFPVVGIPATIENDIWGTDYTIGSDTAANTILKAINEITDTASSHHRNFIIEVMGESFGWLATYTAIAGGGNVLITPELEYNEEKIIEDIEAVHKRGKSFAIVVASEGVADLKQLVKNVEKKTGISSRLTVLGLVQRGGSPTAKDRVRASMIAEKATLAAIAGLHDIVMAYQNGRVVSLNLKDAVTNKKRYPNHLQRLASVISF